MLYEVLEYWIDGDEIHLIHGPFDSRLNAEEAERLLSYDHQDDPVYFLINEFDPNR